MFVNPVRISIAKVVRLGYSSSKLFTAYLKTLYRKSSWKGAVNVNGEWLNHSRFRDDLVLITNNTFEKNELLQELSARSKEVGRRINYASKTKRTSSSRLAKANLRVDGVDPLSYCDYFDCQTLRLMSGVRDIFVTTKESKFRRARHIGLAEKPVDATHHRVISTGKKVTTLPVSKAMGVTNGE